MNALSLPTPDDAVAARTAVEAIRAIPPAAAPTRVRLGPSNSQGEVEVTLPAEAVHLLVRILSHMANGDAVTIMPVAAELTTQKAAELVGVSRPYLIRLLEDGTIPFRKVGTHRRVRVADLVAYKQEDDAQRKATLDELTAEAQELGLGY